ncbi:MAG: hypothetical protein WC523_00040 [Patescibacteria group bacterium]
MNGKFKAIYKTLLLKKRFPAKPSITQMIDFICMFYVGEVGVPTYKEVSDFLEEYKIER